MPELVRTFRHKGLKHLFEKDNTSGVRADQADRKRDVVAHLDRAVVPTDLDLLLHAEGSRLFAAKRVGKE